jgi:hypothetical protein
VQRITIGGQLAEQEETRCISHLLRLWPIRGGQELLWRASLESARTGERRGFASLTDLFAFLEKEVSDVARRQTAPNADEECPTS